MLIEFDSFIFYKILAQPGPTCCHIIHMNKKNQLRKKTFSKVNFDVDSKCQDSTLNHLVQKGYQGR